MEKISIVTVCKNVESTIEKTIQSVLNQTYKNIEYIIQDGLSDDNTLNIIDQYLNRYNMSVFSENDNGLYDAMNRAVEKCNGDYVLFLNSGDVLCDQNVITEIIEKMSGDLIFGNVIRLKSSGDVVEKYHGHHAVFWLLLSGRMPCHQAIFTKTSLQKEMKFDTEYSICADYDFLMRCHKTGCSLQYIDRNISIVDCITGISSQDENLKKMRAQDDKSLKCNYPSLYIVIYPCKLILRKFKDARKKKFRDQSI